MARPLRVCPPGAVIHVITRGNARGAIVRDDDDRHEFLVLLARAVERYQWLCHAHCLLDNHYHLLIEVPLGNLPNGMRHLNGRYAQRFNARYDRSGHLFQARYRREERILAHGRAIHSPQSGACGRRPESCGLPLEQLWRDRGTRGIA